MEWNFQFRIDYLKEEGEERNLKGLIFTEGDATPSLDQIQAFLKKSGYNDVQIKDPNNLIFMDSNPQDPVEIKIVKMGNEQQADTDRFLRLLAEQFIKR
jgi:hypothetical protein